VTKREHIPSSFFVSRVLILMLKVIFSGGDLLQAQFSGAKLGVYASYSAIQSLHLSLQREDIVLKLVRCLLQFFYNPGEGLGVRLKSFMGPLFVCQLTLQSTDGVSC
jgi:hypothetical protein